MRSLSSLVILAALGCSSRPLDQSGAAAPAANAAGASGGGTAGAPAVSTETTWAPYPEGPYGTTPGSVVENFAFLGWRHPDLAQYDLSQLELVRMSDFYDPDGHTGMKVLAVNASAVWCTVCRSEYQHMHTDGIYETYRAKGVEFLGTLFEDNAYYPAQPADLQRWASLPTFEVTFPFVLDPGFKLGAFFASDATPLNMLINLQTMRVISVTMGYSTNYWAQVDNVLSRL